MQGHRAFAEFPSWPDIAYHREGCRPRGFPHHHGKIPQPHALELISSPVPRDDDERNLIGVKVGLLDVFRNARLGECGGGDVISGPRIVFLLNDRNAFIVCYQRESLVQAFSFSMCAL